MKQVVIEDKKQTVSVWEVDRNKIYAFKCGNGVYKLAQKGGTYFFGFFGDSDTSSVGYVSTSITKSVKLALATFEVYEFDTLKEFAEWLVKECN